NIIFAQKKISVRRFRSKRKEIFFSSKQAATGGLREVEQAAAVESSGVGGCKTQDSVGIVESTQQRSCRGDFGGGFRRAKKSHGCRRFCAKKKSEIEIGLFLVRRRQISGFAGPVELQATWAEKEKKIKISV
ncbi:hypothetical protein U1Q18_027613, partial [Sarracenia purpurea var. burkii]